MLGDPIYDPLDPRWHHVLIGTLDTDILAAEHEQRMRTGYSGGFGWIFKRPDQTDQEAFELYQFGTPAERRQAAASRKRHARAVAQTARRAEAEAKKRHVAEWKAENKMRRQKRREAKKRHLAQATAVAIAA